MYYTERNGIKSYYENPDLISHSKAIEWIKLLLNSEEIMKVWDINMIDRLGATSLHYLSTIPGSSEILHDFISVGGDLSILDRERNAIIHYAIKHKNVRKFE